VDVDGAQLMARFSRLSDEELLRVVTTDRAEYRRAAVDLAAAELSRRRVPLPPAAVASPASDDRSGPPPERPSGRARLLDEGQILLNLLIPAAVTYVYTRVTPGSWISAALLYVVSHLFFSAVIREFRKEFFPETLDPPTRGPVGGEEVAEAERLSRELRDAAEDALDALGLEWWVGDTYQDAGGYHVDFYDGQARLRHVVFEPPTLPGRSWYAEAILRELRALQGEPERLLY
jgi:hypothetical protein